MRRRLPPCGSHSTSATGRSAGWPGGAGRIGQVDQVAAAGRGVREPVDVIVGEQPALVAAIGLHHPDLGVPVAVAVIVDAAAIGAEVGAVAMPLAPGQAGFRAAARGAGVDVDHPAAARRDIGDARPVGRDAVPPAGRLRRDALPARPPRPAWRRCARPLAFVVRGQEDRLPAGLQNRGRCCSAPPRRWAAATARGRSSGRRNSRPSPFTSSQSPEGAQFGASIRPSVASTAHGPIATS
jgi:hypothetical protein